MRFANGLISPKTMTNNNEKKRRIYIAGKMTGVIEFNFPAFDAARDMLLARGWDVVSPADLDRAVGFDPTLFADDLTVDKEFLDLAMRRDIRELLECDAIYMLCGWETSTGANAELALAKWMHIDVLYQESPEPIKEEPCESILETAIKITSGDRRRDYDSATPNHERIAGAWNWYIRSRKYNNDELSALDVAHMMILLKMARGCYTPTIDTYVDIAGYAKCSAQIAGFEKE